jgi:hypothetical protein
VDGNPFNHDVRHGPVLLPLNRHSFHSIQCFKSMNNAAYHTVHVVQVRLTTVRNEKLGADGVGSISSHADDTSLVMLKKTDRSFSFREFTRTQQRTAHQQFRMKLVLQIPAVNTFTSFSRSCNNKRNVKPCTFSTTSLLKRTCWVAALHNKRLDVPARIAQP